MTPTPTMTSATASGLTPAPTLTPEPSPTSTPDSLCGSAEEECDANDPDPCGFFCDDETDLGMPCNDECRLDFSVCINPETCE